MTVHFIPVAWLELAAWNYPLVASSFKMYIERRRKDRRTADRRAA